MVFCSAEPPGRLKLKMKVLCICFGWEMFGVSTMVGIDVDRGGYGEGGS